MDTLIENKNDFIAHFEELIVNPLCQYFIDINHSCNKLNDFQKEMVKIRKLTGKAKKLKIDAVTSNIIDDNIDIEYLEKVIQEIIKLCVKIKLSEYKQKLPSVRIRIPEWNEYIFKCIEECAEYYWKHCMLFDKNVSPIEQQRNIVKIEKIAIKCVKNTLRKYIPIETIINLIEKNKDIEVKSTEISSQENDDTHEEEDDEDEDEDDEDEEEDEEEEEEDESEDEDDEEDEEDEEDGTHDVEEEEGDEALDENDGTHDVEEEDDDEEEEEEDEENEYVEEDEEALDEKDGTHDVEEEDDDEEEEDDDEEGDEALNQNDEDDVEDEEEEENVEEALNENDKNEEEDEGTGKHDENLEVKKVDDNNDEHDYNIETTEDIKEVFVDGAFF